MDNDQRQKQLHQINYYRLDRHTLVGITAWIAQGTIMCFASVETSTVIKPLSHKFQSLLSLHHLVFQHLVATSGPVTLSL